MDGAHFAVPDPAFGGADDAWIERLLREDAAAQTHVDDAGFSARVMAALPAQRSAPRWLVPAATVAACAATVLLTPAGGWFAETLIRAFAEGRISLASLWALVPVAVLYGCSFASVRD